jgi:hypothetical protein
MFEIRRYTEELKEEWNRFVGESKNGTFLIDRNYMDYHRQRFEDFSLMFYSEGALYAVLPGNRCGDVFYSHQGLTYGGLITGCRATASGVVALFGELNDFLRGAQMHRVVYKAIPYIYTRVPSEEDLYALFKVCNARLMARDISSVIVQGEPVKWSRDRRYGANKACTEGVEVEVSSDYEGFWKVLGDNLMSKYGALPVHSLEEILLLRSRFPGQIKLYVARAGGEMLGGTLLYISGHTVHAQYISATPEGKRLHAIDAIYKRIIKEDYAHARYIDFGKSTEQKGNILNESLIYQKEGFGGRGVCYDWYEWEL